MKCPFCGAMQELMSLQCTQCKQMLDLGPTFNPPPPPPDMPRPPTMNPPVPPMPTRNPPPMPTMNPPLLPKPPMPPPPPEIFSCSIDVTEAGKPTITYQFQGRSELTFGRVAPADIILYDGKVSRRHFRVFMYNGRLRVDDLKTTHGTFINGQKVTGPTQLSDVDLISVSDFQVRFHLVRAEARAVVPPIIVNPPPIDLNIALLPPNPPFLQASPFYSFEVLVSDPKSREPEKVHRFSRTALNIGSSAASNDLGLVVNGMSPNHLKIFVQDGKVFVRDLNSATGVTLHGDKIGATPREISVLDQFFVGEVGFRVRVSGAGLPEQPPLMLGVGFECSIDVQDPQGNKTRKSFRQPYIIVGRGKSSHIVIPDGNVSKQHACIVAEDGCFSIFDLKSTNGVYLKNPSRKIDGHIKTSGGTAVIEIAGSTLTLTLGQPPKTLEVPSGVALGGSLLFLLDEFFQSPPRRWLLSCFGLESISRVHSLATSKEALLGLSSAVREVSPKDLLLPNSAVLLPGKFIQGDGPPDPVQLFPLAAGSLQLQIVQPMSAVFVLVIDREAPTPRANAVDPKTAVHPIEGDVLYKVAQKFFEQEKFLEARAVFEEARAAQTNPHPFYSYNIACCAVKLGDLDGAMRWLAESVRDGWSDMKHLREDQDLAPLRSMPGFESLFTKGQREYRFAQLHPGDTLQIETYRAASLLVGAFVGGKPWESFVSLR